MVTSIQGRIKESSRCAVSVDKVFRKLKEALSIRISLTLDAGALCVIDTLKDFGKKFSQY